MKSFIFIFAALLIISSSGYSLETNTHEFINEYIARNTLNGFLLDAYLKDQLHISEGIEVKYASNKVWWWLRIGGTYEDTPPGCIPYWRSVRHFHNPLTDAGYGPFESSISWSQKSAGSQSCGHYSWHDVRAYFYNALTSPLKMERDRHFAQTFRGLGQLMHLVQDLSVPAHTRNDGHILYNYEKWVNGHDKDGNPNVNIPNANPIFFDIASLAAPNPLASVPVANLFDTNRYAGLNPEITLRNDIGLSEYANANFFSEDTTFSQDFPYPAKTSVSLDDIAIPDPRYPGFVLRKYFNKKSDGDTGYRLASVSFLQGFECDNNSLLCSEWLFRHAELTDEVYRDYSTRLIPRAVGYSSGLLNYFFRGKIDVIANPQNSSGYVIENKTEEAMNGEFSIYYDNMNDERQRIWNDNFTIGAKSSGNNKSNDIAIPKPADAKEPGKYMLVFQGRLGNETNAVVGKSFVIDGEYAVFTVQLTSLTEKRIIVWDIPGNKLFMGPIAETDANYISWMQRKTETGSPLFSAQFYCGNSQSAVANNPGCNTGCPLLAPGMVDTFSKSGKFWNDVGEDAYGSYGYSDYTAHWNISAMYQPDMGYSLRWFPRSFYANILLPGSPVAATGLRIHTMIDNEEFEGREKDATQYWSNKIYRSKYKFYGIFGAFREDEADFERVRTTQSYIIAQGPVYGYLDNDRHIPEYYPVHDYRFSDAKNYITEKFWSGSSLYGKYSERSIANVIMMQFTGITLEQDFNGSNPYNPAYSGDYIYPESIGCNVSWTDGYGYYAKYKWTPDESRTVMVQAQALNCPDGSEGIDFISHGNNAELSDLIKQAIEQAYAANNLPINEIRDCHVGVNIVR